MNAVVARLTFFRHYEVGAIAAAGLGDLWLDMALHCDVYFDLLVHELTLQYGRMIARHDVIDATDCGITTMGPSGIALISKLEKSASHVSPTLVTWSAQMDQLHNLFLAVP